MPQGTLTPTPAATATWGTPNGRPQHIHYLPEWWGEHTYWHTVLVCLGFDGASDSEEDLGSQSAHSMGWMWPLPPISGSIEVTRLYVPVRLASSDETHRSSMLWQPKNMYLHLLLMSQTGGAYTVNMRSTGMQRCWTTKWWWFGWWGSSREFSQGGSEVYNLFTPQKLDWMARSLESFSKEVVWEFHTSYVEISEVHWKGEGNL